MKLLLVEDEKRMAQALCEFLRLEQYEVDHCADGISGMDAVQTGVYDIIILDIMLPGMSGLEILKKLRNAAVKTPVVMLTAKGELEDKVRGLDCGADDYLIKPFQMEELSARLRALLRRSINSDDGSLSYGDVVLEPSSMMLSCIATGEKVRLSDKEFRIMEYLIANQGQILTREQLALKIWGYESDAEYNNVEVYMSFTRKKLAFTGAKTKIKAVRGIGYELRNEDV